MVLQFLMCERLEVCREVQLLQVRAAFYCLQVVVVELSRQELDFLVEQVRRRSQRLAVTEVAVPIAVLLGEVVLAEATQVLWWLHLRAAAVVVEVVIMAAAAVVDIVLVLLLIMAVTVEMVMFGSRIVIV
jgi:hypothetical protein